MRLQAVMLAQATCGFTSVDNAASLPDDHLMLMTVRVSITVVLQCRSHTLLRHWLERLVGSSLSVAMKHEGRQIPPQQTATAAKEKTMSWPIPHAFSPQRMQMTPPG